MPFNERGAMQVSVSALNWRPCTLSVTHSPSALVGNPFALGPYVLPFPHGLRLADDGYLGVLRKLELAGQLDMQDSIPVGVVVEHDTLDRPLDDLGLFRLATQRYCFFPCPNDFMWCIIAYSALLI